MGSVRLFAALGAAVFAYGAPTGEAHAARKVKNFKVEQTGYAALPPATPSVLGEQRDYREKDVLFSMPLAYEDRAIAAAEIKVPVAGFDWAVQEGDILNRARTFEGGNLDTLSENAIVYCGESFRKKDGVEAHLLTLGLSSIVSRLSNWLQVCVVDEDADGSFEKGFLVGTKKAPDQALVDIAPVSYMARKLEPIPNSHIDVVYYDGGAFNSANFELHLFVKGAKIPFAGIGFPNNEIPPQVKADRAARKKWVEEKPARLQWFFPIKKRRIPQTFTIADGRFTVHAVNDEAKTARITIDRNTTGFPFYIWQQPATIYVYVPSY